MAKLFGALCTYKRSSDLLTMLDSLESQTRQLDHLVVVDNDADTTVIDLVNDHPICERLSVEVIGASNNPGPAGAFAIAYDKVAQVAAADDLFITFDDDDPPPTNTLLEDLGAFAEVELTDKTVAGVGLRGGVLSETTGLISPRPANPHFGSAESEEADHLHGNWFPCYRFGALGEVAGFDEELFWGFEELDVGRRLKAKGYSLRVASSLYSSVAPDRERVRWLDPLAPPSWRHFYRHRNLIRILRRDRAWGGLSVLICARLILKPLAKVTSTPRLALWHLRTNLDAVREGFRQHPSPKHQKYPPTSG